MSGSSVDQRDDGSFEIRGLKPGMDEIEARRHDELPHGAEYAIVPIAVVDADVEGLIVATRPGAAVAGEVVFDGARTDSSAPIYVTAMPASGQMGIGASSGAQVAPDGTFTLRDLFRPVYIRVSTPSGFHLASVVMNGQDITDTPMQFTSGKTGRLQVSLFEPAVRAVGPGAHSAGTTYGRAGVRVRRRSGTLEPNRDDDKISVRQREGRLQAQRSSAGTLPGDCCATRLPSAGDVRGKPGSVGSTREAGHARHDWRSASGRRWI